MASYIRIIVADDIEPILLYLDKVLSNKYNFKIVGKAKNGRELIDMVLSYEPEIVITDLEMPVCNGIEAIKEINKKGIKTRYVVITSNPSHILTNEEKQLGIYKIITKPIIDDKKFIEQIEAVANLKEITMRPNDEENMIELKSNKIHKNIIIKIINKIFKSK